jgi:hypothetical protein
MGSTTGGDPGLPGGPDDQTCHRSDAASIACLPCRPDGYPRCMLLASGIYIGGGLIGLILLIVIIVLILR